MSNLSRPFSNLSPEQEAIRAKCFHPTGTFVEFKKEEVEQSIPERFEKIVRQYSRRLAVKNREHALTYDGLDKMANRVARAIMLKCRADNEPVALLFQQGTPMIVAILGVLKAGKVCVPLIPLYPRAQINFILEDTKPDLVLTDRKNFTSAIELTQRQCPLVLTEEIDPGISDHPTEIVISPDFLACILYTSGSTGAPKGVVYNHRNLIHLMMRIINSLHICSEDRLTLLSTYNHIAGQTDIFRALLSGAALFPRDLREEGLFSLADWLAEEEITIYHSVPSVFRQFIETLDKERQFPKIRVVHLGGEPVLNRDVELYKNHFSPPCIFLNRLGATEISGYQQYLVDKNTRIAGDTVPAGYAVEDMEVLLLNDNGERVGFDHEGEIAIKSRYLSVGYWRRPDLTQAKFLADPNGGDERIYLTGDLGRIQRDGCLIHLGRKDFQVKLRGHRIEAAAIEAALLTVDGIKEAVVVVREDQRGEKQLVAYIVPVGKPSTSATALRRALTRKLPEHMVPSVFVSLDSLPLTPNGKIDRSALPVPEGTRPELDTPFAAPRTPVEKELSRIWAEVLSLDQVGIYDNFFDLGGHSLAATRVVSQVIKKFQLEIPLRSLFQSPTIAEMAAAITAHQANKLDPEDLNRILAELESLPDRDAQRLLADV